MYSICWAAGCSSPQSGTEFHREGISFIRLWVYSFRGGGPLQGDDKQCLIQDSFASSPLVVKWEYFRSTSRAYQDWREFLCDLAPPSTRGVNCLSQRRPGARRQKAQRNFGIDNLRGRRVSLSHLVLASPRLPPPQLLPSIINAE